MNIRTDIICSECDVDLKDKVAMNEKQCSVLTMNTSKPGNADPMTEKTLTDLIRNNQLDMLRMGTASVQGFATPLVTIADIPAVADYCHRSEVIGNEWVIPSKAVEQQILDGNEFNYIHMAVSLKIPDCKVLVLCEVRKDHWSDGSYKRSYHPLSYTQLKRMPE